jgi:hypothetical protein
MRLVSLDLGLHLLTSAGQLWLSGSGTFLILEISSAGPDRSRLTRTPMSRHEFHAIVDDWAGDLMLPSPEVIGWWKRGFSLWTRFGEVAVVSVEP